MFSGEISQTEKDKNHRISLMWDVKRKGTNEQRNKQTHRHRRQNGGRQREAGWREEEEGEGGQICGDGRSLDVGW